MKCLIVLVTIVVGMQCKQHMHNYAKTMAAVIEKYHGAEGAQRILKRSDAEQKQMARDFVNFVEMVDDINDDKSVPWNAEYNKVSIMSQSEKAQLTGVNSSFIDREMMKRSTEMYSDASVTKRELPDSIDWVARGAQPAIKNQGSCGSCWTFGAVSALEADYYIYSGDFKAFSEQEYLDCVYEGTRDGCNGGWMMNCYNYNRDQDRHAPETFAPYTEVDGACNYDNVANGLTKAKVTGYSFVRGDDDTLKNAVVNGVVTVAIYVVNNFFSYRSGVYTCSGDCDCSTSINHAVTVVGYGSLDGHDYWKVRNSWGDNWGDGGYVMMTREQSNICNINSYSQVPNFACRDGETCETPEWDDSNNNDDSDDGDSMSDKGNDVECGQLVHFGGRCVSIDDSADKFVDLSSVCERMFCLTDKDYLYEDATGYCVNVDGFAMNDQKLKLQHTCTSTWEKTAKGLKHKDSGKCWHPYGGLANPGESTNVVIWDGCDEDRLTFQFEAEVCWEVENGMKLKGKLAGSRKYRDEEDAKEACVESEGCTGLNYLATKKKYQLRKKTDMISTGNSNDKAITMVECADACESGEERCEDGECKTSCDGCPSGTIMCNDGVCRHEHMCH